MNSRKESWTVGPLGVNALSGESPKELGKLTDIRSLAPTSLMSSFFEGRGPFDDHFFNFPFGGMFESSFFGPSDSLLTYMHPPAFLDHPPVFLEHHPAFLEHQPSEPRRSRGSIIEELNSDDEKEAVKEKLFPYIAERKSKYLQHRNDYGRYNVAQQQPKSYNFTFSSSSVTYGGSD
ncbi:hypothetical protein Dsin_010651 [Dipteronia sinensis]|uniref:Uncharacterized protein n=1 Tax=Dipteronia sinensis TaxID=43782 RepID=A0AAE0ECW0_9ROSI|nr:hypothetical protein Dsin_010651 [Dipteronia sinensis]